MNWAYVGGGGGYNQISINKGSAINPIDVILLKSTIHDQFLNSYSTQFSTVKICYISNLDNCEY